MEITLERIGEAGFDTLDSLMQLYLYDFSVHFCDDPAEGIGEDGRYRLHIDLRRYLDPTSTSKAAYLSRVDGQLAGFLLIGDRADYAEEGRLVEEFFVLTCYRRMGVGRAMAMQAFETYSGHWEIPVIKPNESALAFWRDVVGEVAGDFEERINGFEETWLVFETTP